MRDLTAVVQVHSHTMRNLGKTAAGDLPQVIFEKYPIVAITFGDPHNIALIPGFDTPAVPQVPYQYYGIMELTAIATHR